MNRVTRIFIVVVFSALLTACGGETGSGSPAAPAPTQAMVEAARDLRPADERLAAIYERSCRTCHAIQGMNAPLTGDVAAWALRSEARGADGLLKSTRFGYRGMPPRGLCQDCSDEDFVALINFMSSPAPAGAP